MSVRKSLNGPPPSVPQPPGRILDAKGVAELLSLVNPGSKATNRWVTEHVPGKRRIGHRTVRWLEREVVAWVEAQGHAA